MKETPRSARRPQREYRFFTQAGEVDLAVFLEAIAARGEARVVTEAAPAYRLTAKGRRAVASGAGEVA
jgi:hypothetical protein